jgi:hypothetical protein
MLAKHIPAFSAHPRAPLTKNVAEVCAKREFSISLRSSSPNLP